MAEKQNQLIKYQYKWNNEAQCLEYSKRKHFEVQLIKTFSYRQEYIFMLKFLKKELLCMSNLGLKCSHFASWELICH